MKDQHENPNIEIINKNLWAVRFSLISMIPQISWKPDPSVDMNDMPADITPEGLILLNKDFKYYSTIQKGIVGVMKLNDRQLTKELVVNPGNAVKSINQTLYWYCLHIEKERRKVRTGGVK